MSLRKSPRMTPALLEVFRRNARCSTGPRTAAGKRVSRFNALKHGGYAALRHHHETTLKLGEDPRKFEGLKQEIGAALGPEGGLTYYEIEYLAKRHWRRERLERTARTRVISAAPRAEKPHSEQEMAGFAVAAA